MNIDPSTTKYLIKARLQADGIVEKPDVVGAIFGQTEGLLGDELDLRDLQKSGRIGRIEVDVSSKKGKSEGEVTIPSSLDQVETAILASSLETIDRVGPCRAQIDVATIEDVRLTKRAKIVDRAKVLLARLLKESKTSGLDLTESVRQTVQMNEITTYGPEKCPAGPNVDNSDAIIVVEGRADVLNLLRAGIKNAIAVNGTNVPKTVKDLSKERVVTAFVDGDRGGELILRELLQVAEVDFIARAPRTKEVEELTNKQIMKSLRNKIPAEQFIEMYGIGEGHPKDPFPPKGGDHPKHPQRQEKSNSHDKQRPDKGRGRQGGGNHERGRGKREEKGGPPSGKKLSDTQQKLRDIMASLSSSSAKLIDKEMRVLSEIPVRTLADTLKGENRNISHIVFDGIITQRLLDIAVEANVSTIVGTKLGNVTKHPASVEVYTREDLE